MTINEMKNSEYLRRRNALIEPAYTRASRVVDPSKKEAFVKEFMKQMTEAAIIEGLCRPENMTLFLMPTVRGISAKAKK